METCPKSKGERHRPTSARWSARPFPLMPMCEGTCNHFTTSPKLVNQVEYLCPQVHMFHCTRHILPLVPMPPLGPIQDPLNYQQ